MCLDTKQEKPIVTRKNRTVYVVRIERNGHIYSPFFHYNIKKNGGYFLWILRKLYYQKLEHSDKNIGFHSFKGLKPAIAFANRLKNDEFVSYPNVHVRIAKIPACSLVWEGLSNNMVANNTKDVNGKVNFVSNQLILGRKVYEPKENLCV